MNNPIISPAIITLSDLNLQIRKAIDGIFKGLTFWVIADITSYTYKSETNYHYFELVEKDKLSSIIVARIAGRAWGNAAINITNFEVATGQKFKNDINVLVQVNVQYHKAYGLQLNLIDIDTNFTLGKFEQQRNATLERLVKDNPSFINKINGFYVTNNNKLYFKKVIQHIAVIASFTSAGLQDFEHTLRSNAFNYIFKVDFYDSKVQGEENARPMLEKLIEVYNSKKDYDAIAIIRGGGAQSDFILFDNYELSRAVAKFPIPIITGIGHQKNETIVDLMAHSATKTPTKAAELIIAHNKSFEESLVKMQKMIIIKSQQQLVFQTKTLNNFKAYFFRDVLKLLNEHQRHITKLSGIFINRPKMLLINQKKDVVLLIEKIQTFNRIFLAHKNSKIEHYQSIVKVMSPAHILNKGFAIIKINGDIINNAKLINVGTELIIQLAKTEILTIVKSKKNYNG